MRTSAKRRRAKNYDLPQKSHSNQHPAAVLIGEHRVARVISGKFRDENGTLLTLLQNDLQRRGTIRSDREAPALLRCLTALRLGDILTVWKLDRLGRSLRDLITMLEHLRACSVKFQS